MSETVYIETSIFGHLTARPTENLILAANINDLKAIFDDLREKQIASGRKFVKLPIKRVYNPDLAPSI